MVINTAADHRSAHGAMHLCRFISPLPWAKVLALAAVGLCSALGQSQTPPSPETLLSSWVQNVADLRESASSYRLDGRFLATSPFQKPDREIQGRWTIVHDGKRLRWEFHIPESEAKIIAFDGERWHNFSQSPTPEGASATGNILKNPEKVIETDPREPFLDGLAIVYPFTLEQFVGNAAHTNNDDIPLPEIYLRRSAKLRVSGPIDFQGKPTFKLTATERTEGGLPEVVYMQEFERRFVPVALELHTLYAKPGEVRQQTLLRNYVKVGEAVFPQLVEGIAMIQDGKGGWKTLQKTRMEVEVRDLGAAMPHELFTVAFPDGTVVYDEEKGRGIKIGEEHAQRSGHSTKWILAGAGAFLILGGSWVFTRRREHG